MNGVEILSSNEVVVDSVFAWGSAIVAALISLSVTLLIGLIAYAFTYDVFDVYMSISIGILIGILAGYGVGLDNSTPTKYETQYKVAISDEVSMNDFLEQYEIIDQEGKIYTVREANQEMKR